MQWPLMKLLTCSRDWYPDSCSIAASVVAVDRSGVGTDGSCATAVEVDGRRGRY